MYRGMFWMWHRLTVSQVLLIVYAMYLLFQLKSHAYMYQSTPQNLIDEELAPGPVAAWLDSSTSDSDTSSESDSDESSGSHTTAKRFKRVMRGGRRRRKSSSASKDTAELTVRTRGSSIANGSVVQSPYRSNSHNDNIELPHRLGAIDVGDEADNEGDHDRSSRAERPQAIRQNSSSKKEKKHRKKRHQKKDKHREKVSDLEIGEPIAPANSMAKETQGENEPRRVDFAVPDEQEAHNTDSSAKRPFNLRALRPTIPKSLSQNVFTQPSPAVSPNIVGLHSPPTPAGPIPRVRYGIRRTNSLPDRLKQTYSAPPGLPITVPPPVLTPAPTPKAVEEDDENISRTTAVLLLLISTGLVAICAEFMVDSISSITNTPGAAVSEAFIGLIILPIVGNAAEHVVSTHTIPTFYSSSSE